MQKCTPYDMKWWHFLIPSKYEFYKLCESYEKTYMFIVAFIRFIFYVLIFKFLHSNEIVIFDEFERVPYFLFVLFLTITTISFLLLIMIAFKKQLNPQKQVEIERERPPPKKKPVLPIEIIDQDPDITKFQYHESGH